MRTWMSSRARLDDDVIQDTDALTWLKGHARATEVRLAKN